MDSTKIALTGSIVALVTPLLEDTSVDFEGLRRLLDWHIEQGTSCVSVAGTTGESPTLTMAEHQEVIKVAVEHAAGRIPVMAGCGANSTAEALELARYARKVGADSQLQVVPYYNKPTQEGLYQHFTTIAAATQGLPMYLYNVPGRTVADLQHETVLRLARVPGIIGIKEASGNIVRAQWLIREALEGFAVFSGDDLTAVALMLCGGHGNISVTANLAPALMSQLCSAALAGDAATAAALQRRLLPLHAALFSEANPIPVKWAMQRLGLCGATLRQPLTPLSTSLHEELEQALGQAGLLN